MPATARGAHAPAVVDAGAADRAANLPDDAANAPAAAVAPKYKNVLHRGGDSWKVTVTLGKGRQQGSKGTVCATLPTAVEAAFWADVATAELMQTAQSGTGKRTFNFPNSSGHVPNEGAVLATLQQELQSTRQSCPSQTALRERVRAFQLACCAWS